MELDLKKELAARADPAYRAFQLKLLPGVTNYYGVRLPELRKLARAIPEEALPLGTSFEERMLEGMVIARCGGSFEERCARARRFLPKIDNWSVCDSFCAGLRWIAAERARYLPEALRFARDPREFVARYGIVILLFYYLTPETMPAVFDALDSLRSTAYYAEMAAAWCVATAYRTFPEETARYLERAALRPRAFSAALRKIRELRSASEKERALTARLAARRATEG